MKIKIGLTILSLVIIYLSVCGFLYYQKRFYLVNINKSELIRVARLYYIDNDKNPLNMEDFNDYMVYRITAFNEGHLQGLLNDLNKINYSFYIEDRTTRMIIYEFGFDYKDNFLENPISFNSVRFWEIFFLEKHDFPIIEFYLKKENIPDNPDLTLP